MIVGTFWLDYWHLVRLAGVIEATDEIDSWRFLAMTSRRMVKALSVASLVVSPVASVLVCWDRLEAGTQE